MAGKKGNSPTPGAGYSHSGGHMGPAGHKPPGGMAHHTSSADHPAHPKMQESAHQKAHGAPGPKHSSEYYKPAAKSPAMPLGSGGKQGGGQVSDPDGDNGQ